MPGNEQCREAELLRKENEELRYQLSRCIASCKSREEVRELLVIIRKLEERIEALSEENERLRRELEKCNEGKKETGRELIL